MALKPYADWQHRVVEEHRELAAKHEALVKFMESDKFDTLRKSEQHRMIRQSIAMQMYREVLWERVFHFQTVG